MTELDPKLPVETCQNVGATCPEDLPLLKTALARGPSSSWELPEHRVSTENTNNKIGESLGGHGREGKADRAGPLAGSTGVPGAEAAFSVSGFRVQ